MGRFYIVAGMFVMLSPILLASFFADLTRRQGVILGILLLCAVGMVAFYNTETFDDLVWRLRRPAMPSDERLFVSTATQIREDATQYQDGPHLEALLASLCRTPIQATGWTGRILNSFDSSSKRGKVVLLKVSPHITRAVQRSIQPTDRASFWRNTSRQSCTPAQIADSGAMNSSNLCTATKSSEGCHAIVRSAARLAQQHPRPAPGRG